MWNCKYEAALCSSNKMCVAFGQSKQLGSSRGKTDLSNQRRSFHGVGQL